MSTPSRDDKIAAIVTAVWSVIATRGIAAVSFRTVADEAGVSIGRVQHYLGTKEHLVRRSAEAMIAGAARRFDDLEGSPGERVRFLLGHVIPTRESRHGIVVWHAFIAASVDDPELAAVLQDAKRGQEREVARLVAALAPTADPEVTARRLVAIGDGLAARVITGDLTSEEATTAIDAALSELGI